MVGVGENHSWMASLPSEWSPVIVGTLHNGVQQLDVLETLSWDAQPLTGVETAPTATPNAANHKKQAGQRESMSK